jgi:GAF domain-containing protein
LPVGDELAICVFGLFGELTLASPDLFERIRGRLALLAAAGGHAGTQLERAQLLDRQRRLANA